MQGWESDTYCVELAGSTFGFALNSGRIAGEWAREFAAGPKDRGDNMNAAAI